MVEKNIRNDRVKIRYQTGSRTDPKEQYMSRESRHLRSWWATCEFVVKSRRTWYSELSKSTEELVDFSTNYVL